MKFYGQWDPPVDKVIYERYFPKKQDGFFIECGAFDGKLESCCLYFERFKNWTGINIEAAPNIYKLLEKNRTDSTNLNVAFSNKAGTATFNHVVHPTMGAYFGNGSIKHCKEHLDILIRDGCTFQKHTVPTITYKAMIEEQQVDHVDLFVLDVEGHELSVLNGMKGSEVWPDVFCIEYPHVGLKVLKNILTPQGYKLDHTSHNNAFFVKQI